MFVQLFSRRMFSVAWDISLVPAADLKERTTAFWARKWSGREARSPSGAESAVPRRSVGDFCCAGPVFVLGDEEGRVRTFHTLNMLW
jgi:hypothetical protein